MRIKSVGRVATAYTPRESEFVAEGEEGQFPSFEEGKKLERALGDCINLSNLQNSLLTRGNYINHF